MTGYLHQSYAVSLAEFGMPRHLPCCDGWILVSPISGTSAYDARGCYPLFTCRNWPGLCSDLEDLGGELVSLVLVTDPFGDYEPGMLAGCFPDLFRPYKEHYVTDLTLPLMDNISRHHARNLRKAQSVVQVEHCPDPLIFATQWTELYSRLILRHNILGISAFSAVSLRRQLQVPGLEMFRAFYNGETVGIMLMYVQGEVGYYHLAAYSETGYKLRASYALVAHILDFFAPSLRWISLGAGAGLHGDPSDGLTRFKRSWATDTRLAYICGRIFKPVLYHELARKRGLTGKDYFPLYRKGEAWWLAAPKKL